jgi:hypothetical protein
MKWSPIIAGMLTLATPASAIAKDLDLANECARVNQVYPRLMLASMMEGDVNCGDPDSGEFVSCYADETPAEKIARERRLAIRQHQEAGYKIASEACGAWEASKADGDAEKLRKALADARAADSWRPEP